MEKYECDKCNGTGSIPYIWPLTKVCPKCWGFKELDWIEMIKGKEFVHIKIIKNRTSSSGPR